MVSGGTGIILIGGAGGLDQQHPNLKSNLKSCTPLSEIMQAWHNKGNTKL